MRRVCVFFRFFLSCGVVVAMAPSLAIAQVPGSPAPRTNAFNDPFVQVTSAIPACPVPEGPLYTEAEVRELAHVRSQHGGSCHRVGRCRLPNSYLYDVEIIPRVQRYIQQDGRFDDTSVWVLGERRLVTLKGCVQSQAQSEALEKAVWLVDDVMGVINLLQVGTARGAARYPLVAP
ncbi:BON domain-containing protein [Acidovorax sp. SD340]|nr:MULTISPECIES: BON domain-containing protein [Acidovorax]MBO1009382.1 BON domain-containing protein [Acidovorax sp. SD340]MCO4243132.1 BON domain-containing protein [Acidovorax facilis]HCE93105.1 BON domain-containing protein [Acidovorax sp.]